MGFDGLPATPEAEVCPTLICVTDIGDGPSESESLKRTPGALEVIDSSSKTELVSATACGGLLVVLVLMEMVMELLESDPSVLVLPAKSENVELPTEITPLAVLSRLGLKFAV